MKVNKAFRNPFITKKAIEKQTGFAMNFLEAQYKVYKGASILYFNASFSDVPSCSKTSQPPA